MHTADQIRVVSSFSKMKRRSSSSMTLTRMLVVLLALGTAVCWADAAGLKVGFYATSCPKAEQMITTATNTRWFQNFDITPGLMRIYFHDCFVHGCDASLLIKSTPGNKAELDVGINLSIHGLDLIDTIKAALEKTCPGVVSCADIIALATRDSVVIAGGTHYDVPTGRRDGRVSLASQVNLPGASQSVASAFASFQAKGFTIDEMVTLLGAHTMGVAHCGFFNDRLWNFKGTKKADPTMDPTLVAVLKKTCPQNLSGSGNPVALDQVTKDSFDNVYYQQLLQKHGILQIDQELSIDPLTSKLVNSFAGNAPVKNFQAAFGPAMVKLGNVGVLTGTQGEIRKICSKIN